MTFPRILALSLSLVSFSIALGCGGDSTGSSGSPGSAEKPDSSGSSGAPASSDNGNTECGVQRCSAGSYCLNLTCAPGCLSETNCTSSESCEKQGGNSVGSCQAKSTAVHDTPEPDCDAFAKKAEACDPQGWAALLSQCSGAKGHPCTGADLCGALKTECISCFNEAATCGDAASCKTVCRAR